MSKAILLIDMPKCCNECAICASYAESAFSPREYWCTASDNTTVDPYDKPKWCPLKYIPDKRDDRGTWTMGGYIEDGYSNGWNDCVNEILGDYK